MSTGLVVLGGTLGFTQTPVADLHVSQQGVPASWSILTHHNSLSDEKQVHQQIKVTVTWKQYTLCGWLVPFTTHKASNCFLCASINRALLTAVPVNTTLLYPRTTENFTDFHLSDIHSTTLSWPTYITPFLLWCKGNAHLCVTSFSSTFCIPGMIIPPCVPVWGRGSLFPPPQQLTERDFHSSAHGTWDYPFSGCRRSYNCCHCIHITW